jgi:GNAT superfamily N-acetyltransferase
MRSSAEPTPRFRLVPAIPEEAEAIADLRNAVARHLTTAFGYGHWSSEVSERAVLSRMRTGRVYVARRGRRLAATLCLATKKPWAIEPKYFTPVRRPVYLTDMAVTPDLQRQGIGRRCLAEALRLARDWPAQAIRLDAYDAAAGAGGFYQRCGYREMGRVVYREVPLIYYEALVV